MNPALARRLDAIGGLMLAAAAALWWLGSTRLPVAVSNILAAR